MKNKQNNVTIKVFLPLIIFSGLIIIGSLLHPTGVKAMEEKHKRISVPILMYHHFSTNPEEITDATMTPEKFETHLDMMQELGYESISFDELDNFVNGNGKLPDQPIIITIDDGYTSNYEYAYPALAQRDMKATINMIGHSTGLDELPDGTKLIPHFTWEQAKEMMDSGVIEIGAHSFNMHENGERTDRIGVYSLDYESVPEYEEALTEDFTKIYDLISEHTKKEPIVLAYPFGFHTEPSEKIAKEVGYKATLLTETGTNYLNRNSDLYLLKRNNVPGSITDSEMKEFLERFIPVENN